MAKKMLFAIDRSEELLHDPKYVQEALDVVNDFVKNAEVTETQEEPKARFDTLDYLTRDGDIIAPEQWNDFVEYVNEVFNYDLSTVPPTALFSKTEMLEWADSYRGI